MRGVRSRCPPRPDAVGPTRRPLRTRCRAAYCQMPATRALGDWIHPPGCSCCIVMQPTPTRLRERRISVYGDAAFAATSSLTPIQRASGRCQRRCASSASANSCVTVFQLRAVAVTPRPLHAESLSLEAANPYRGPGSQRRSVPHRGRPHASGTARSLRRAADSRGRLGQFRPAAHDHPRGQGQPIGQSRLQLHRDRRTVAARAREHDIAAPEVRPDVLVAE